MNKDGRPWCVYFPDNGVCLWYATEEQARLVAESFETYGRSCVVECFRW